MLRFAAGFIPGSYHIQYNKSFSTWAGWLLNYEEQFMLIARDEDIQDLTRALMRIGLDNIYGFISDVTELGVALEKEEWIDTDTLKKKLAMQDLQYL